jgi:hypothetical protein
MLREKVLRFHKPGGKMRIVKICRSLMSLIFVVTTLISACSAQPTLQQQDIVGVWTGDAQWMCGHGDPAWATTFEFRSNGTLSSTMTIPNLPDSTGNGVWSLVDNRIEIKLSATAIWTGDVSHNKMAGTFQDTRDQSCTGNWSLVKQ